MKLNVCLLTTTLLLIGCGASESPSSASSDSGELSEDGGTVRNGVIGDPVFYYGAVSFNPGNVTSEYHMHEFDWSAEWPYKSYDEFEDISKEVQSEVDRFLPVIYEQMASSHDFLQTGESPIRSDDRNFVESNFLTEYVTADITVGDDGATTSIIPSRTKVAFYYEVPGGGEIEVGLYSDGSLRLGSVIQGYGVYWDSGFYPNVMGIDEFCVDYKRWGLPEQGETCIGDLDRLDDASYNRRYAKMAEYLVALKQLRTGIVE